MGITTNKSPNNPTPVYNDVGYSVSSNNTTQTNFKYVADVYWAGATAPIRKKQPAEPSNGYCYFDVAGVLKSYVTRDPAITTTNGFAHASNSYINYTVQFGEEYGASSATTVYPNLTTATGTVWNASYPYDQFMQTVAISQYTTANANRKFLTEHPGSAATPIKVQSTDTYTLYFLNTASAAYNVQIKTYDSSGTLIQTVEHGSVYTTNDKVLMIGCGPSNLGLLTGSELRFSGSLPVVSASVDYYTVQLVDSGGSAISVAMRFKIYEECSKYDIYRLQFLNYLGGYDFFSFYGAPKKTTEIQRDFYKKRQGSWSSNQFVYSYKDRSKTQYNTIAQDSIRLVSDWTNPSENSWLEGLVSSPDVYYYDPNLRNWIACTLADSGFEYKTRERDGLFNLEVTIQPSFNRYRQQF